MSFDPVSTPFFRAIPRRERLLTWLRAATFVFALLMGGIEADAFAAETKAPEEVPHSVTLQTDLITPFFGAYYLEANIRTSNQLGLLLNTSYLTLENGDWKTRTGTLGAGLTYYFQGEALRRWYVEAVGEANFSWWRHEPSKAVAPVAVGYTGILVGGYRFIWSPGLVLDLAAGVVVLRLPGASAHTENGVVTSESLLRVYPAAKLGVGWAF